MPQRAGTFVAGDVTGKAIWAVLVMAGTCALLEAPAPPLVFLGAVLGQVSDRLFADIPARMFLTCLPWSLALLAARSSPRTPGTASRTCAALAGWPPVRCTGPWSPPACGFG
jgi:hypothetical protein